MRDWQVNIRRTCAQPVTIRAMPENEIPPAMRVDNYSKFIRNNYNQFTFPLVVERGDAVDNEVEVRRGTVLGFHEHAVFHDLRVGDVFAVVVDVCHVRGEVTVLIHRRVDVLGVCLGHGELGAVKYVERARFELGLDFLDLLRGAFCCCAADVGEGDGTRRKGTRPVGNDLLAVHDAVDHVLEIGLPVDVGGNDEGVGAGRLGAAVVGDVGNAGRLAGRGSAHGVSVLGDECRAAVDEVVCALALERFIEPAARIGDFHGDGDVRLLFDDGLCVEEEGGVARNDFRIGECADVADLDVAVRVEVIGFELVRLVHLDEFHDGCSHEFGCRYL